MITFTHTNGLGKRTVEIPEDIRVIELREDDTPFGKQTLISGTGVGAVWVDGTERDVRDKLKGAK